MMNTTHDPMTDRRAAILDAARAYVGLQGRYQRGAATWQDVHAAWLAFVALCGDDAELATEALQVAYALARFDARLAGQGQ